MLGGAASGRAESDEAPVREDSAELFLLLFVPVLSLHFPPGSWQNLAVWSAVARTIKLLECASELRLFTGKEILQNMAI